MLMFVGTHEKELQRVSKINAKRFKEINDKVDELIKERDELRVKYADIVALKEGTSNKLTIQESINLGLIDKIRDLEDQLKSRTSVALERLQGLLKVSEVREDLVRKIGELLELCTNLEYQADPNQKECSNDE